MRFFTKKNYKSPKKKNTNNGENENGVSDMLYYLFVLSLLEVWKRGGENILDCGGRGCLTRMNVRLPDGHICYKEMPIYVFGYFLFGEKHLMIYDQIYFAG